MGNPTRSTGMRLDLLGRSEDGRPIRVLHLGREDAPLRVLILSGQHGDERGARRGVRCFARTHARDGRAPGEVALAVVRNLNPDGAARHSRRNARGVDLNRDHLRLDTAEVRSFHQFVRSWAPHLVIDVHEYPARRTHLLARGLAYCHDLFLDVPTNPAVPHPGPVSWDDVLLRPMIADLSALGYRSGRYTLVKPSGRVRHSTPDILDARNGLSLRYRVPCLLLEGRHTSRREGASARTLVREALAAALGLAVRWAVTHRDLLTSSPPVPLPGESVVVRSRYAPEPVPFAMAFRDVRTGGVRQVDLSAAYTPRIEATRLVTIPRAFAVPTTHRPLLDLLARHGFPHELPERGLMQLVESFQVERLEASRRKARPPHLRTGSAAVEERSLDGYLLFPTNHAGGRALVILLEPASKYGLARFSGLGLRPEPGTTWPALRLV